MDDQMIDAYQDLAASSGGQNCTVCNEWHPQAEIVEIDGEPFCQGCIDLFFPEYKRGE